MIAMPLRTARSRADCLEKAFQQLTRVEFGFRTLDEANELAQLLAEFARIRRVSSSG